MIQFSYAHFNRYIEYGPFAGSLYNDDAFAQRMLSEIQAHNPSDPLFYFWAYVLCPLMAYPLLMVRFICG